MFTDYHTIICCTASRQVPSNDASESSYVQGSGDDTENWACGLTPPVFWKNRSLIMATDEAELPDKISALVAASELSLTVGVTTPIPPTTSVYISTLSTLLLQPPELRKLTLAISLGSEVTAADSWLKGPTILDIGLGPNKLGSRNLRTALPEIINFVTKYLITGEWRDDSDGFRITIACSTGKDHSVGVALALLCLFFSDSGQLMEASARKPLEEIDKAFIRRRLSWIMTAMPDANPSRATLQSVNSYLMERP